MSKTQSHNRQSRTRECEELVSTYSIVAVWLTQTNDEAQGRVEDTGLLQPRGGAYEQRISEDISTP